MNSAKFSTDAIPPTGSTNGQRSGGCWKRTNILSETADAKTSDSRSLNCPSCDTMPFLYESLWINTILAEFVGQRWTNESSISACTYEGTEKEMNLWQKSV